jgi:transposase
MPGPYPREFREDVVAVARRREARVTMKQVGANFGVSEATLQTWLKQADIEEGRRPGPSPDEAAEMRELRRRNRLLEQENEVFRRAAALVAHDLGQPDDHTRRHERQQPALSPCRQPRETTTGG